MTIIVLTHELPSVFAIADHVVMLDFGEVIFSGNLDELRASDNEKVKRFLERKPYSQDKGCQAKGEGYQALYL